MILLQYSRIGNVVKKRDWFFHAWRLKRATSILHLGLYYEGVYPPRCMIAMANQKIVRPWAVRILGFNISVMPTKEYGEANVWQNLDRKPDGY